METFLELLEQANSEIKQISCSELKQELGNDNLVIVDVRSKEIIQSDGVIEGIEVTNGWDAVGVQWHPENMLEDNISIKLFEWLNS